jgi:glycerol-3-phosphate acyltransferase PlsY
MDTLYKIISLILSYLIGSVPFGLLFAKAFSGVDVRIVGSRNIGATNVLRSSGKKAAILTLLADMLKGFLPPVLAMWAFQDDYLCVLSGAAAILGHNFPVYLGFKGGKGVATSFGVILAVSPLIGAISLLAWLAAAYIWRYSSLSALIAFALYPFLTFAIYAGSKPHGMLSLFIAGLIYYRHRENIQRLLAGTEPRIGEKR